MARPAAAQAVARQQAEAEAKQRKEEKAEKQAAAKAKLELKEQAVAIAAKTAEGNVTAQQSSESASADIVAAETIGEEDEIAAGAAAGEKEKIGFNVGKPTRVQIVVTATNAQQVNGAQEPKLLLDFEDNKNHKRNVFNMETTLSF